MTRKLTAALLLLGLLAACDKPQTTTTTTTVPASTARYVYADSLGAQIASAGLTDDGRIWQVESGASLERWESAVLEAAATVPTSITLALGSNDAGTWKADGGWTQADADRWAAVTAAVDPRTCLTVVLPHFEPSAEATYLGVLAEIDQARTVIAQLPAVDVVRDWRPPVAEHPEWIAGDGIHLWAMGGTAYRDDPAFQGRYQTVTGGGCP